MIFKMALLCLCLLVNCQILEPSLDPGYAAIGSQLSDRLDETLNGSLSNLASVFQAENLESLSDECQTFKLALVVHLESDLEPEIERFLAELPNCQEPVKPWQSSSLIGPLQKLWSDALECDLKVWAATDLSDWVSVTLPVREMDSLARALTECPVALDSSMELYSKSCNKNDMAYRSAYYNRFNLETGNTNLRQETRIARSIAMTLGLSLYRATCVFPAIASGLGQALNTLVRDRWANPYWR
jgi:hypothetical protein